jgi:DNA-binding MarR family transcriptional regulator
MAARVSSRPEPAGGSPSTDLTDVLQFMQLLWALVHAIDTTSKRMRRELGVTGPQRLVLRVVGLSPGVSAGALATTLRVHPSTLTGVLQRLARQGLLRRSRDAGDRRRAVLHLTARGAALNAVRKGTVEAAVAEALGHVPAGDRAATRRVLSLLASQLDRLASPRGRPRR